MGLEYVVPHIYAECPLALGNGQGLFCRPFVAGLLMGASTGVEEVGWEGSATSACVLQSRTSVDGGLG